MPLRPFAVLLLLSQSAGCASSSKDEKVEESAPPDDTTSPGLDPATVPLAGACPMAADYGGFVVSVSAGGASGEGESNIAGSVADGVVPATVLEELGADGDCALLRRNNPYCDPVCDPGEVCDFTGACLSYPSNQDLGTVTVEGLAKTSTMEAVFPGNTYYDTAMSHPAFQGGELIHLAMPDGTYGPLDLYGVGVEPLDLSGVQWIVADATDLAVSWPAPTVSSPRSEIVVEILIHQHGVTPSTLRCSFADDGEGTVSGAIITALLSEGVSGFPMGTIERRTADHGAAGEGCLDFIVSAPSAVAVDVLGYTPCFSDAECPEGQTCDVEMQICE